MTEALLWLAVAVPLVAAVGVRLAPRAIPFLTVAGGVAAAAPAWALLWLAAGNRETTQSVLTWLPAGGGLEAGLRFDALSAVMAATVATVGVVVLLHASGYFADDPRARSALAWLLAFLAAMQGLVLADGFLTLLIFWELVGAASARLIAYNRDDPEAAPGAVRAFLTTRTADLGLYIAVLALLAGSGGLGFDAERPAGVLGALVGLGLVAAAVGKSAQAPLQTWLAGAMAGPTPVSALLHSATMVAAGVYLLVRSHDLLAGWPLEVAGWIGAVTAVAGAAIALAQDDLKRILAGSTTSQLGLMFVGVAAAGPAVAVFHLVAHAAGKAGLFLAAGVFQHHRGTTRLSDLRGAGRDDRPAFAGFAIAALSIAAVPPLAGFFSKEHIAAGAEAANPAWFVLVLLAAAGSAGYLLRPVLVLARAVSPQPLHARGRGPMLVAVTLLAAATVAVGFAGKPLAALLSDDELPGSTLSVVLSLAAVMLGAAAVALRAPIPRGLRAAARDQLYAPRLLRGLAEVPAARLAAGTEWAERRILDPAVDGIGRGGLMVARLHGRVEERGLDAGVDGLARAVGRAGTETRRIQTGRLHEYLRDAALGATALSLLIALTAVT